MKCGLEILLRCNPRDPNSIMGRRELIVKIFIIELNEQIQGPIQSPSILKGQIRPLVPASLHKIFENIANSSASANLAFAIEENGITRRFYYSQVDAIANNWARCIIKIVLRNNLTRNDDGDYVIAVSIRPSDYLVILLLAIWKAGAAYLPLDSGFPKLRVEHILHDAKPTMVIFDEDDGQFRNIFKLSLSELLSNPNLFTSDLIENNEHLSTTKDQIAVILYTSGSTGVTKGVRLSHTTIFNRLQWQFVTFPYSKTETAVVFKTVVTFVDSILEIWGPLLSGIAVLVVPRGTTQNPEKLVCLLEKYKIERLVLVPSLLRAVLMYFQINPSKRYLPYLKTWLSSGETLTSALVIEFYRYFPSNQYRLCNFYGSTEIGDVTYHIVYGPEQANLNGKIPIGLPIHNTIVYLLDSDLRPVNSGDVGELYVAGLNLASGYVNGRDAKSFIENPIDLDPLYSRLYRTGDFARIKNGILIFEGRIDSQIKVRGRRVDLSEIENAIKGVRGVEEAAILCYKPGDLNQAILSFVTTTELLTKQKIEITLKKNLISYIVPQVILVDEIPLLVNGKVDRHSLLKMYERCHLNSKGHLYQHKFDYTGVSKDKLVTAKVIFETIASVLNILDSVVISTGTNFYEIGGNSLNSIFTITALNEKGYYIGISDFIEAVTLGEVVTKVQVNNNTMPCTKPKSYSYVTELLKDEHKTDVISIITKSFYLKADLEKWMITELFENVYEDLLNKLWEPLVQAQLSFVVKTESGKTVGVALNFDARCQLEVEIQSKLNIILEFLDSLVKPVLDNHLPTQTGTVFGSFLMGTTHSLSPKENVGLIHYMEGELIRLAQNRNFHGVLTTNTSPLTQQLADHVFLYKTLLDYQVNEYVASDGRKPFGSAPDSQRVLVQWKVLK